MKRIVLILILLGSHQVLSAQVFQAEISHDTVYFGNQVQVSFIIENLTGEFEAPSFKNFVLTGGPNINSSYQYINGDFTKSQTYSYILQPQITGEIELSSGILYTDKEKLESEPIKIYVLDNPENIIQEIPGTMGLQPFGSKPPLSDSNEQKTKKKSKRKLKKI